MVRHHAPLLLFLTRWFEVPVIVLFTKYDQFLRNVEMHMMDYPDPESSLSISEVAEKQFQEHFLRHLPGDARFVRLKSELGSIVRIEC